MIMNKESLVQRQTEMSKYIGKRKHCSQLEETEIKVIWERLKNIENWNIRTHALDRLEEKGIHATYNDLVSVIHDASIIEYKIDYNSTINRCDERVVVRANSIVNYCYNLNVVYSISQQRIITVWINHINDRHKTLRWELYDENMKVFMD